MLVHGGPTGNWEDRIDAWGQLLVAKGYLVMYPNIRGSIGYGEKFIEMNRGDWGGGDFKDVMAGVEDLINKGFADPDRLGIGGWSYGGYMSEWAVTQTPQFKAAVSGAGMSNLISEYGTEQHPAYDEWFYGLPYEKPEGFLNSSPFLVYQPCKDPNSNFAGRSRPHRSYRAEPGTVSRLETLRRGHGTCIVSSRAARISGSKTSRRRSKTRGGLV